MTDRPGEAYVHRQNQLLKKLLGAKSGEPLNELEQSLVAAIILENDRPEYSALASETLFSGFISRPVSGAGNVSRFGVLNPPGSNIILTITRIRVANTTPAADTFNLRTFNAQLTGSQPLFARDQRLVTGASGNPLQTPFNIGFDTPASGIGSGQPMDAVLADAGDTVDFTCALPLILAPGTGIQWFDTTVNQPVLTAVAGYYRAAQDQTELALLAG